MKVRNLRNNRFGTVDMEIEHPQFGWIPFTANPDDPEEHGRVLYQEAVDGVLGDIAPYEPPSSEEVLEQRRNQASLSREAFMLALDEAGLYDQTLAVIEDPATERRIKIRWRETYRFRRTDRDLVSMAKDALGLTDEQMDAVFGIGEQT